MYAILLSLVSPLAIAETIYRAPPRPSAPIKQVFPVLHQIAAKLVLVFGVGMVLMSIYKYTEYKKNPEANPLGSVFTLLLTGLVLIGVSLIPMQVLHLRV